MDAADRRSEKHAKTSDMRGNIKSPDFGAASCPRFEHHEAWGSQSRDRASEEPRLGQPPRCANSFTLSNPVWAMYNHAAPDEVTASVCDGGERWASSLDKSEGSVVAPRRLEDNCK